jgi:pilus assembly protein CpaD
MSLAAFSSKAGSTRSERARRIGARISPALLVVTLGILGGCTNYDHVIVGAVPDDYRTAHPIVIAERQVKIDLPVGSDDRGMTNLQKTALDGFLQDYDRRAGTPLQFLVPIGSVNEAAAHRAVQGMVREARKAGIAGSNIAVLPYQVPEPAAQAPIRVSYAKVTAGTNRCGRWPEDLGQTADNKHYEDFGCSSQNNLAAQISNPADLLGPRKLGDVDAGRRSEVIGGSDGTGGWRANGSPDMSGDGINFNWSN